MFNHMIVFSCGYNCIDFVEEHCESIHMQDYQNYTHVLVDDGSTDGTYEKLVEYKLNSDRNIELIHYMNNFGSQANSAINHLKPEDDDIIVWVDMDDCLADPFVLSTIVKIYLEEQCWLTHGSFVRKSNETVQGEPYPESIKLNRDYRTYHRWLCQHLTTFKGFLWNNINKEDLKDQFGEWSRGACDLAVKYPMLEMSPPEKVVFTPHIFYIYNDTNPLNEFKIRKEIEQRNTKYFKSKSKYEILKR